MADQTAGAFTTEDMKALRAKTEKTNEYLAASIEEQKKMMAHALHEGKVTAETNRRVEAANDKIKARKEKADNENKLAQVAQLEAIEKANIFSEEFNDQILADLKKGITYDEAQLEAQFKYFDDLQRKEAKEDKDKRLAEQKEEERLATNQRSEENLSSMLGIMGLSQETADRVAKRAMQMKESVHKWWEDKKGKIAAGAKSILEWLMKAAGIGLLWLLFKYLATLDWVKLYDTVLEWWDKFEYFWGGIVSIGAWFGAIHFYKWAKALFGPDGGFQKFTKKLQNLWKSFKNTKFGGKLVEVWTKFATKLKGLWTAFKEMKFVKAIASWAKSFKTGLITRITDIFTKLKSNKLVAGLLKGIQNLFKAGGAIFKFFKTAVKPLTTSFKAIVNSVKAVFNAITKPFKSTGSVGGIFDKILKFVTKIPGIGKILGFVGKAAKMFAKLFAPITLVWGIVESLFAGWDAAEKEKGGLGAKIMAFMSGALKKLLDFFIFDLAQMVQDGIQWAIKWVMGLFGFSEEEQKAATDWDLVGAVRDAIFKAIDWIKGLFSFGGKPDGTGFSFKGLAPLVDILMFPLNAVFKWLGSVFGWDTTKDGKKKKDFSLGNVLMGALDAVFEWIAGLFKIDFGALAKNIMPEVLYNFLFDKGSKAKQELNKLGFIDEDTFSADDLELDKIQKEIDKRKKEGGDVRGLISALANIAKDESIDEGDRKELTKMLKAEGATIATGGLFSGGMALVGERGPEIMVSTLPAKVIPAQQTADLMSGMGGGQNFAPTTIVNSAPSSTTTMIASSSSNPISQKYFRSD